LGESEKQGIYRKADPKSGPRGHQQQDENVLSKKLLIYGDRYSATGLALQAPTREESNQYEPL
jgi:hypothetical protein